MSQARRMTRDRAKGLLDRAKELVAQQIKDRGTVDRGDGKMVMGPYVMTQEREERAAEIIRLRKLAAEIKYGRTEPPEDSDSAQERARAGIADGQIEGDPERVIDAVTKETVSPAVGRLILAQRAGVGGLADKAPKRD